MKNGQHHHEKLKFDVGTTFLVFSLELKFDVGITCLVFSLEETLNVVFFLPELL